jgi:plastocyanin
MTLPPAAKNRTWDVVTNNTVFTDDIVQAIAGDTVRWSFSVATDGDGHNVRFTPRIAGSPTDIGTAAQPIKTGTQSRVFSLSGDFHYVCDLHGSMVGEVIVK